MEASDILAALDFAQRKAEKSDPFPLRPSGLGRCQREIALILDAMTRGEAAGISQPIAPESLRVMERGHQRGEILAQRLREGLQATVLAPVPLWVEIPAVTGASAVRLWEHLGKPERLRVEREREPFPLFMAGEADAVILPPGAAQPWLIDFKAQGAYSFGKTTQEGREGPDYTYIVQLYAYATAVADMLGEFPRMALVCEAQDSDARKGIAGGSLALVEVSVEQARQAWAKAMSDLAETVEGFLAGIANLRTPTVPPPKGRSLDWRCCYCRIGPEVCNAFGNVVNEGTQARPKWKLNVVVA